MPQLIAIALAGAGLYAGYKWVAAKAAAALAEAERARTAARQAQSGEPRDLGKLELDPVSGVYKPPGRPS